MKSDQVFGLIAFFVALAYIAGATQIQTSFLADPVGPRSFPVLVGAIAALCALAIVVLPDSPPRWPSLRVWLSLLAMVVVLIGFALLLKPFGFLLATALAAGFISFQIKPDPRYAVLVGIGLSVTLFVLFRYLLGLGLRPYPLVFS